MSIDQIREFFYWTASILAILVGIFIIALLAMFWYIKKLIDRSVDRLDYHLSNAAQTWRNYTVGRTIIRILRLIF